MARFKRADIDEYLERQRIPAPQESRLHLGKLTRRARRLGSGGSEMQGTFNRFTKRAKNALALAQEEAHRLGHDFMGPEHILLGLIAEGEGVAARVLTDHGLEIAHVRRVVESVLGRGDHEPDGELPLTPRSKRSIELAVEEAGALGHDYLGTEHLLLGLLREGEGEASAGFLRKLGLDLSVTRDAVIRVLKEQAGRQPLTL